ncbi:uncharacterized protein LOC130051588 [Ostrea edulis]|uniref:uncharacterized protein LOC130051588 n=1 Tax=Ostrea edulis TaxID=37623 RepID=UPI0024AE9A49|nr:uncharacterized protein LOC130051588 [Ostrea edulis]
MKVNHNSTVPVRDFNDNWMLRVVEPVEKVTVEYEALDSCVKDLVEYQPIDIIDFEPDDKETRRKWITNLSLSNSVALFPFQFGNYLGNMNVLWKIPGSSERDTVKQVQIINKVKKNIMKFSTRKMQKEFIDRYKTCTGLQPVILRNMYLYLTEFEYQANSANAAEIDERFMKFLLESEDCDLIFDLRKNNCRPTEEKFKPFWKELSKFFDEKAAVHERRSNDKLYLPFAISVEDLRRQILDRLPEGSEALSVSWLKLNFSPANVYNTTAKNYTGQYNVRFAVQQRLVRVQHLDSHYCAVLFLMLKEFACQMREYSTFQCMDDKAIVPLGEPGHPVSTGVRAHHGGLIGGCMKVVALDFHVGGIIPSVCFMNDIPENPKDSFYNGHLYVTVKDKVFQAPSPLRHSTESVSLMRQCYSDDDVNLRTPVLIRYTDGGPDHRTTYKSVKICTLMEFIALDLDMIVCARTVPCGSYANPAERTMSLLNLALQNVALERTAMSPNCEMQIKSVNSLKSLRNLASKNQRIKEEYTQAVGVTLNILKERFKRLSWKGESVCVQEAASQEEMNALVEILKVLDENIQSDSNLSNLQSKAVDAFLESHSRSRQYIFQIKKCLADNCGYCVLNPPRLPDEVFQGLHFVPDPTKDENGQYKGFKDLYGTETNDMDRPSLKGKSGESSERDKKFKAVLVGSKYT